MEADKRSTCHRFNASLGSQQAGDTSDRVRMALVQAHQDGSLPHNFRRAEQAQAGDTSDKVRMALVQAHQELPDRLHLWLLHLHQSWGLLSADLLCNREEAQAKGPTKLQTEHVNATCYMLLVAVAAVNMLQMLSSVILPVILAAGIAVLMEPFVFIFIDIFVRCCTHRWERPGFHGVFDNHTSTIGIESRRTVKVIRTGALSRISARWIRGILCVFTVSGAIALLLSSFSLLCAWAFSSIDNVDWTKYMQGERVQAIRDRLDAMGVQDYDKMAEQAVGFAVRGAGMKMIGVGVNALASFLLMILCLGFFLIDSAVDRSMGKEPWRPSLRLLVAEMRLRNPTGVQGLPDGTGTLSVEDKTMSFGGNLFDRLRVQMRLYIMAKFYLSVLKALILGTAFACMGVDLWILWTMLTFTLNFMPFGSSIATVAPLPFVLLDPQQSLLSAVACVALPLAIHNIVGNVVEPRIFASSLNLHPISVLLSLAFWGAMWGVLGALVCVPLTAMIRVLLLEFRWHPYAAPILSFLEGREQVHGFMQPQKESES